MWRLRLLSTFRMRPAANQTFPSDASPEVWMLIFQMPLLLIGSWPLGNWKNPAFLLQGGSITAVLVGTTTGRETIHSEIIVGWSLDAVVMCRKGQLWRCYAVDCSLYGRSSQLDVSSQRIPGLYTPESKKVPENEHCGRSFFHCVIWILHTCTLDNPYRISRFKKDQRESSLPLCNRCFGCTVVRQASCNENVEGVHGSLC